MLDRNDIMEILDESKLVEVREYAKLVTQLLTEGQIKRISPFFVKKVDFDWKSAKQLTEPQPFMESREDMMKSMGITEEDIIRGRQSNPKRFIQPKEIYDDMDTADDVDGEVESDDSDEDDTEYEVPQKEQRR